jgi:hypothetical protein
MLTQLVTLLASGRGLLSRLILGSFFALIITAASLGLSHPCRADQRTDLLPRRGEIQLEGEIHTAETETIGSSTSSLNMAEVYAVRYFHASAKFVHPDGRKKTILVDSSTAVHNQDGETITLDDLQNPGYYSETMSSDTGKVRIYYCVVVGSDEGIGKPIHARLIAIFSGNVASKLYPILQHDDIERLDEIVASGFPVDYPSVGMMADTTPMYMAADSGSAQCMKALIDAGADPNAPMNHFQTPLYAAISADKPACVRLLLKAGVDPKARFGTTPMTPLDIAKDPKIVALLKSAK